MARMADIYERTGKVETTDHVVTSYDGAEFAVRVHRPIGVDGPLPAILWLHGGGLVAGTHRLDDGRFDRWCPKFGVVGVAVDYGLAPERPYPGPIEDSYAALRWTHEHAAELGIVAGRVGIGGSSAGGNQAAALALLARDRGELAGRVPGARVPDARRPHDHRVQLLGRADLAAGVQRLRMERLPRGPPRRRRHADLRRAGPGRGPVGAPADVHLRRRLDGFLDEDVDYASRLLRAGVPVELHVYPGAPHGFDLMMVNTDIARRCRAHLDEWLGARLG